MKVLSILNLSNKEKAGADSGVIFNRLFFGELVKHGFKCTIASPIKFDVPNIKNTFYEPGSSKYDVRFRFDWDFHKKLLLKERPDLVFVNQVELTSNYRALLVTTGNKAKIATYCHYLPVMEVQPNKIIWDSSLDHNNLAKAILFQIFNAYEQADYFFVTSNFSKELLIAAAKHFNIKHDKKKIMVLPCPTDPYFITEKKRSFPKTKQVLYNHRLYKQYGTEFLIQLIKELQDENIKFIITDFFSKRNADRKRLEKTVDEYKKQLRKYKNVVFRIDGDNRQAYKHKIVLKADIGIAPYRINANWSMGSVDCLGMGIPVVAPNFATFPVFVPSCLLFDNKRQAIQLIRKLLTDKNFWESCSEESKKKVKKFLPNVMVVKFINYISDGQ
jgi:glycosyltransferase involved in cell wall biosynthesis